MYKYIKSLKLIKRDINGAVVFWVLWSAEISWLRICLIGEFIWNVLGMDVGFLSILYIIYTILMVIAKAIEMCL